MKKRRPYQYPVIRVTAEENAHLVERVRALLDHYGTQAKLAKALGITQGTLSLFLAGKHRAGPLMVRGLDRLKR